jgi:hypothetical protein
LVSVTQEALLLLTPLSQGRTEEGLVLSKPLAEEWDMKVFEVDSLVAVPEVFLQSTHSVLIQKVIEEAPYTKAQRPETELIFRHESFATLKPQPEGGYVTAGPPSPKHGK